jgi:Cobalamin biosynthesis protein CobT VWA domain
MAIEATRERLETLAAGLCLDAGVRVEVGSFWAWQPLKRTIVVSGDDLGGKGPDYCTGVLAHEVGHYWVTRYHLFHIPFPSQRALAHALNGIEDPRVNTWMRRRYPGTVTWFARLTTEDALRPCRTPMPRFQRFVLESAREELLGWRAASSVGPLPPAVEVALDETRRARRRYAVLLPPADLDLDAGDHSLSARYRREVRPRLQRASAPVPERWEQVVRFSMLEALTVAEVHILPAAARLLEQDVDRLADQLQRHGVAELAQSAKEFKDGKEFDALLAETWARSDGPVLPAAEPLRRLALRLIEDWLDRQHAPPGLPGSSPLLPPSEGTASERTTRSRTEESEPQTLPYDQTQAQVAGQIDELVRHLEAILRPTRSLRPRSGYPTGQRLDLRRVMAYEADPRRYGEIWMRNNMPKRRDAAFSLLVDLSGSMRGNKIEAAQAGTVLLAETLHRVGLPFAVHGFQDVLIPFCRLGDGFGPAARRRLGEMPQEVAGDRPDGNNQTRYNDDGPCLLAAAEDLLDWSAAERVLIVISDGHPEGKRSTKDDLRRAVEQLTAARRRLTLLALGLGSGTDHVRDYYPEGVANIPPERLAAEIGALLRRHLEIGNG